MQLKEFNILLDIKKHNKSDYFEVVQGDSYSNVLNITLVDGLNIFNLTNTTVEIVFNKSDGTTVQQTDIAVLNAAQGKIQCVLKTNTIASPGKVIAEVRVLEGDTLLTSTRFEFYVRKSLITDETIESTNEFPVLTQLINTTEGLITQVEQIEKQVPEQVVTDLNAVSTLANQLQTDLTSHKAENVSLGNPHGIDAKANKIWESPIAVTLQNGWAGTLEYSKNDLGEIWLRGTLTAGTVTNPTVIGALPVGYRPTKHRPLITYNGSNGTIVLGIVALTTGNLTLYGAVTGVIATGAAIHINEIFK